MVSAVEGLYSVERNLEISKLQGSAPGVGLSRAKLDEQFRRDFSLICWRYVENNRTRNDFGRKPLLIHSFSADLRSRARRACRFDSRSGHH